MNTKKRIQWSVLILLAILPVILTWMTPYLVQAMAADSPLIASAEWTPADAYDDADTYLSAYPYPYPFPHIYLPTIFSNFSFSNLWNTIASPGGQ